MSTCLQEIWSLDGLQEIWSLAGAAARASGAPDDRGVFTYYIPRPDERAPQTVQIYAPPILRSFGVGIRAENLESSS